MKVAIVHDWITGMRGGERCLEAFCELFPDAELYTLLHRKGSASSTIERHVIHTSVLQRLPFAQESYRNYLPLFPLALRSLRIEDCDLVLSLSHCVAKAVRVPERALHVCYMLTPMRYVWDQYGAYFGPGQSSWSARAGMKLFRQPLQRWDARSNGDVDHMVAISRHVADRISRYYKRGSQVVYPPVDMKRFEASASDSGYYLIVSAFAPYKRLDIAVEAFNRLGLPLKIIGTGQQRRQLQDMAGANIEFLGWKSDAEIQAAYMDCRALIFPGEEDFGIVPLEAMACGKPVIAYGKGGILETVIPADADGLAAGEGEGPTGLFFPEQSPASLEAAVLRFESLRERFDPEIIHRHARLFSLDRFKEEIRALLEAKLGAPLEGSQPT